MLRNTTIAACVILVAQSTAYAQISLRRSSEDLAGWKSTVEKNAKSLNETVLPGATNDLSTSTGQSRFLDFARRERPTGVNSSLAKAIDAWKADPQNSMVPLSALKLIIDQDLTIRAPDPTKTHSADINIAKLDAMSREEVEPDIASDTLKRGYDGSSPPARFTEVLNGADEKRRESQCGTAVRNLRSKANVSGIIADRIFGFDSTCLFSGNKRNPPPLTVQQRQFTVECAAIYQDYKDHCLATDSIATKLTAIQKITGILSLDARGSNGQASQSIFCSATLVAPNLVLTARHCLTALVGVSDATIAFHTVELPDINAKVSSVRLPPSYDAAPIENAVSLQPHWLDQHDLNADIVLFGLTPAAPSTSSSNDALPIPEEAAAFRPVALSGFQRLLVNAMLLQARLNDRPLFDDADLLQSGEWRRAFGYDASPTCTLLRFNQQDATRYKLDPSRVWGNFCQSLNTSSGGGLFSLRLDDSSGRVSISGVISRAILDYDMAARGQPVESLRPNNAAVVLDPTISDVIRKAQ